MSQNITYDNVKADDIAQERLTAYISDIKHPNKELVDLLAELCDWASDVNLTGTLRDSHVLHLAKMIGNEINHSLELA